MAEIVECAFEHTARPVFLDVLQAYDELMALHGLIAEEDAFFYPILLKMNLHSEPNWSDKRVTTFSFKNVLLQVGQTRIRKPPIAFPK